MPMARRKNQNKPKPRKPEKAPVAATPTRVTATGEPPMPKPAKEPMTTMQRIEFGQFVFNGLLVVAAFVAIIVSCYQYSAMRQQNDEMLKQTKSTQDQLVR